MAEPPPVLPPVDLGFLDEDNDNDQEQVGATPSSHPPQPRYGCISCRLPIGNWTRTLQHLQECCPGILLSLQQQQLRKQCQKAVLEYYYYYHPTEYYYYYHHGEAARTAVVAPQQPYSTTSATATTSAAYGCPSCGELTGKWNETLIHMRSCCYSDQYAYATWPKKQKRALMETCRRVAAAAARNDR